MKIHCKSIPFPGLRCTALYPGVLKVQCEYSRPIIMELTESLNLEVATSYSRPAIVALTEL